MDGEIFEKPPVLGACVKWLGVLLCGAIEWRLFYESIYLYMNPSVEIALSSFCQGGTMVHDVSHGLRDAIQAVADVFFKAACGNG